MTLMLLITTAYRVQNVQVIGGPSWINTARFDIDAKGPETAATAPEVYAMVRTLLANRFKLVIRNETRELPVYALVVAKGGPKFKTAEEGSCKEASKAGQLCPTDVAMFKNGMAIIGGTTQAAATILGRVLEDRYVIDKTGLIGRYDISCMWKLDEPAPRNPFGREEPGNLGYEPPRSAFVALEEQAGLRLEPTKDKVPVLVIESVQMPEPN